MFNYRIYILTVTACLGSFLFGYDTGFIGGAVTLPSFQRDFGLNQSNTADITGNVVASLQAGCFFGSLFMAFFTDRLGRKKGLMLAGLVMAVGSLLQTVASGRLGLFYAGRVVSGLGVGAASMLVPTYVGEMAPKKIRGRLLQLYGFFIFFGIAIAYWIDYACQQTLSASGHNQWRVTVALQIVPAAGLTLGMIPLKESPRWLIKKGRDDQARQNLIYIRHETTASPEIMAEYVEIHESVQLELRQTDGVRVKELWLPVNRKRVLIGFCIMVGQQMTGTNLFTYYAPEFFKEVGLNSTAAGLFATGVYGIVKATFAMLFLLFLIERVGRRPSLLAGAAAMSAILLVIACVLATHPPKEGSSHISGASMAMIIMVYLYCISYACSWGGVPWTYVGEIYPNRIREYCVAMAASTQWAFNYCISKTVPIAIKNIGWRVFLMFAIFNAAIFVFTFLFIKETKGLSLEQMDELFGVVDASIDVEVTRINATVDKEERGRSDKGVMEDGELSTPKDDLTT